VITESIVQSTTIIAWMERSGAAVSEHSDYLTQLDSAIGDGDHGLNMSRGFDSVNNRYIYEVDSKFAQQFLEAGADLAQFQAQLGVRYTF